LAGAEISALFENDSGLNLYLTSNLLHFQAMHVIALIKVVKISAKSEFNWKKSIN